MPGILIAIVVFAASVLPAAAQSAACNRAKAIAEEVERLYSLEPPDHRAALEKLRTAHQLCPTLGVAWQYAYCSARALGDEKNARVYRDRAVFNGVTEMNCGTNSGPDASPRPLGEVRNKYALVIGIGRFRDAKIPHLQYAAKDATDFADLLRDPRYGSFPPENVTVLTDEEATRGAILNAMQQIFLKAREDDMVVTYVSSHGSPKEEVKGLGGIGYIVTYDASVSNLWLDGIDYQDFARKTSLIKARRKVTFLDTCYSGQASRRGEKALSIDGVGVDDRTAKMFLSGEGTYVITSSKSTERSWESENVQNSYFTYYLVDAFKRAKEPPTLKEVFAHVTARVSEAVARDKQASQHPQMVPSDGSADVRIGVTPRTPTAVRQ